MSEKKYWLSDKRFYVILFVLVIFWLGLMTLFYLKADEVTKNPCQVCSKRLGENVLCSSTIGGERVIFYPDFKIEYVE